MNDARKMNMYLAKRYAINKIDESNNKNNENKMMYFVIGLMIGYIIIYMITH